MPLPDPRPNEAEDEYVERCMLSPEGKETYPILPQRANACRSNFSRKDSKRMAELRTETITGVEVMRIGRWQGQGCPEKGCEVTGKHLDNMVAAFKAIGDALKIPVKLGHSDKQKLLEKDGLPSAGWIANLRRKGEVLIADFADVPGKIADLIRAGAYMQRSSEIKDNLEVDGTTYPNVLTGVALLGAQLPAVDSLADIKAAYGAEELEYDDDVHYAVENFEAPASDKFDADEIDGLIDALMARLAPMIKGKIGAPTLRGLGRALKEGIRRAATGKRLSATAEKAIQTILSNDGDRRAKRLSLLAARELARESGDEDGATAIQEAIMAFDETALRAELGVGDDADLLTAVKELKAKGGVNADPDTSKRLTAIEADLTTSQERVLTLEADNARAEAVAFADEQLRDLKILPAQKDEVVKMYIRDPESTKTFVSAQPTLVDTKVYGTEAAEGDYAAFEPTTEQIAFAKGMDNWPKAREGLMVQNAEEKGVEIPAKFFADPSDDD